MKGKNVLKTLKRIFLRSLCIGDDGGVIRGRILEDNWKAAVVWASVSVLFWSFCLFMSFRNDDFRLCMYVYIAALAVNAVTLAMLLLTGRKRKAATCVSMYLIDLSLLGASVGIAVCQPEVQSVTIIASVLIVSVTFLRSTLPTILLEAAAIAAIAIFGRGRITPVIYTRTVFYTAIFAVAGILIGHVINRSRFDKHVFSLSAEQFAELQTKYAYFDEMTGLANRRAYSEAVERLDKSLPSDCCLIMVDVNGLKTTNDEFGHPAGDELIEAAAECIKSGFPDLDTIFRLGGDEFCIIMNGTEEEAEERFRRINEACSAWKGQYVNGVSLSYGIASGKEHSETMSLIRAADRKMYEFKRNYYMSAGHERRRR